MKLNQLIAIVNGEKTKVQKNISELYKKIQHPELMVGISRKYTPVDDEGEKLPEEHKRIQFKAGEALEDAREIYGEMWDLVFSQDDANCKARADIVVDGVTILTNVPVTHLLYLEKQLTDLYTFVSKLPTLDPGEEWKYDTAIGCFACKPKDGIRTKKVPRNHVKAEATKEHPAQVEVYTEDVVIGYWKTFNYSAALETIQKVEILENIDKLKRAVKMAREEANSIEVSVSNISKNIFEYVFGF